MTNQTFTQSQKRFLESVGSLFDSKDKKKKLLFLKSSSDQGVIFNGGRNGAKYAPQSLLSSFKKLTIDGKTSHYQMAEVEVANPLEEQTDFKNAQVEQSKRIGLVLEQHKEANICHLGGGHDHIYSLLLAYAKQHRHVVVINVDAHADTRTDDQPNSGTPFRQFAHDFNGDFHLYEIGLHPYSNSQSTLTTLSKGKMSVLWRDEVKNPLKLDQFFSQIKNTITKDTVLIFSLDADALDGNEVPGVSAINPDGLSRDELIDLWRRYRQLNPSQSSVLGIYELNPVYDSPSMLSMRRMAAFIFETIRD